MIGTATAATTSTAGEPAGKRERTKAQNRTTILGAAREAFTELGFGATSVRDIVRRTDLASGTFYNYFPDKETVFAAVLEQRSVVLRQRLRELRGRSTTLDGLVGDGFRAYFTFIAEDREMFELLRRNAGTIRTMFELPSLEVGILELLEDLREATARGDLPASIDADYLAAAMGGVAIEVGVRMVERDPVDVDAAATFATSLFLGGIARLTAAR
jgi:AcrR family transcriptional regulator